MKLSVGLPVRNGELFLEEAIDSILAQTYDDFELIISDNGSTDRTLEISRSYTDPRIRVEHHDINRGAAWNFNRVFELSTAEFFKWAAHDDLIAPEFFAECMNALEANSSSPLCYTGVQVIDAAGNALHEHAKKADAIASRAHLRFKEMVFKQHPCHHIFGIFRSAALRNSRLIGRYMASDRVLLAQLALVGTFLEIPRSLFFWRRHSGQSIRFMKTPQAYTRWFDPATEGRFFFPNWRLMKEYYKIISESRMGASTCLTCLFWLSLWPIRYAPWLGLDFFRSLKRVSPQDQL